VAALKKAALAAAVAEAAAAATAAVAATTKAVEVDKIKAAAAVVTGSKNYK